VSLDYSLELRPDTIFVVTQTLFHDQAQYLFITNILLGTSLKIKSPCLHYVTNCLSHAVKNHGVPTVNNEYKRLILDGREVIENLCKPDPRERSKYYEMIRNFVGTYFLFSDKTYPENHYFLGKNNFFGISYGLQDKELIISNTLNGKAMKMENADTHEITAPLTEFMKSKGVCDHRGEFCLALLSGVQTAEKLGQPSTAEGKRLYRRLTTFLSDEE